jgi:hypothetical protein
VTTVSASSEATAHVESVLALSAMVTVAEKGKDPSRKSRRRVTLAASWSSSL